MSRTKHSATRAPLTPRDYGKPAIQPFDKSLDGKPPYLGNPAFVLRQSNETNDRHLEELLAGIQKLEVFAEIEAPEWDPPSIEDKITDVDVARCALIEAAERGHHREPEDYDEARVWKELYLREYARLDEMRQVAQNLDDTFREACPVVDEHNSEVERLSALARRLQLDIGL